MDTFKIGDKVEVLDEAIKAHVIGIAQNTVRIETTDGFEMEYEPSQLVKIVGELKVTNYEVAKVKDKKDTPKKQRKQ